MGVIFGGEGEIAMIHYCCYCCGMTATCVVTQLSAVAWEDHMATHEDPSYFQSWTWGVTPLPLTTE